MLHQFFASWHLFQHTYVAGGLISLLLSLLGVLVVARNQIFVGAAISQASTLGIALTLWAFGHHSLESPGEHYSLAVPLASVFFSVLAALITVPSGNGSRETPEAITGWVFLLSASFSILVVSHSPLGLEEIYRLLSSSLIGAAKKDIFVFGSILIITVGFLWFRHRSLLLFALDPAMAVAVGLNLKLWSRLTAIWLGIGVGMALQVSGMLFTFGCLVLPALIAKNLGREVRTMFWLAPGIALANAIAGFVLANYYDFPPAQMTIALLCIFLFLTWVINTLRSW